MTPMVMTGTPMAPATVFGPSSETSSTQRVEVIAMASLLTILSAKHTTSERLTPGGSVVARKGGLMAIVDRMGVSRSFNTLFIS